MMFSSSDNPILVDVRTARVRGSEYGHMLWAFTECVQAAGHYMSLDWVRITDEDQIDHARRVLTRLTNLTKVAS